MVTPTSSTPVSGTATPSTTQPITHPAYNLLKKAHHSAASATSIFTDKVRNKPLLLAPSHQNGGNDSKKNRKIKSTNTAAILTSRDKDKRSLRRHIRQRKKQYYTQHTKPRPLSAKEKRQLKVYDLSPSEIRYDIYRGLNKLWTGYIFEVLGLNVSPSFPSTTTDPGPHPSGTKTTVSVASSASTLQAQSQSQSQTRSNPSINPSYHGSLIASADFHGMKIEVVQSNDVGRVGLRGIIVRETRSTFAVVTRQNRLIRVLKRGTVFRVTLNPSRNPDSESESESEAEVEAEVDSDSKSGSDSRSNEDMKDDDDIGRHTTQVDRVQTGDEGTKTSSPRIPSDGNEDKAEKAKRQPREKEKESNQKNKKLVFDLHGSQLEVRPVERAVRKFKWKRMDRL